MGHEKESSSPQNSHESPGLIRTFGALVSGVLFGLILSKLKTPPQQSPDGVDPHAELDDASDSDRVFSPRSTLIPPSQAAAENNCKCCYHKTPWWKVLLEMGMFLATTGAFVAAAIYAGLTSKQLNTAKEHFRTDERAWIGIDPMRSIPKAPRAGKFGAGFDYELYLRNTGKSVARCVEIRVPRQASQSSIKMGDNVEMVDNIQNKFLLGKFKNSEDMPIIRSAPKALAPGQVTTIPLSLFGQEPQIFTNDEWVSYFVGRVDYMDEFGVPHWVKFCLFVADARGNLWYCRYGNDEDNNPEVPPDKLPSCPVDAPS